MLQNLTSRLITLVIFLCSHFVSLNWFINGYSLARHFISRGDFQDVPLFYNKQSTVQEKTENTVQGEENAASAENEHAGVFSCPDEGCVSTFQRLCNLEYDMHYSMCIFVEERHSLLDKAKILYTENTRKDLAHSPLLPVLSFQSKVLRRYHRAGHCDLRRRLPFSVLSRRPT